MVRPRSVSDQTIIAQAYELLMEQGPAGLTFERLGARVGLVPAALVRRFQTKQHLLLEVDRYSLTCTDAKVDEAMEHTSSPIDAILAQFTTILGFASTLERFVNGQEFLLMDFRDKQLYVNYQVSFEHRHRQVVDLLGEAKARGELAAAIDCEKLAVLLEAVLHGAGHLWAMSQQGTISKYIEELVHTALRPYIMKKKEEK